MALCVRRLRLQVQGQTVSILAFAPKPSRPKPMKVFTLRSCFGKGDRSAGGADNRGWVGGMLTRRTVSKQVAADVCVVELCVAERALRRWIVNNVRRMSHTEASVLEGEDWSLVPRVHGAREAIAALESGAESREQSLHGDGEEGQDRAALSRMTVTIRHAQLLVLI